MWAPVDTGAVRSQFEAALRNDPLAVEALWLRRPAEPLVEAHPDTGIRVRRGLTPDDPGFSAVAGGMFVPEFQKLIRIIWHPVRGNELIFNQAGEVVGKRYMGSTLLEYEVTAGDMLQINSENFLVMIADRHADRVAFQAVKSL